MKSIYSLFLGFKGFFWLSVFLFGGYISLWAQRDTLYVNDTHNLALLFPSPIERAITGHPDFSFGFDGEGRMRLGLLQGHPGRDSNLLVLTRDGSIYSYALAYRKVLKKGHRFIGEGERIGRFPGEKPLDSLRLKTGESFKAPSELERLHFEKGSLYFLGKGRKGKGKTMRKGGVRLRIWEPAYFGTETYVVMELENCSKIDFEVDDVSLYRVQGKPGKSASYQKLELLPLYKHQMPSVVRVGRSSSFAFVLPKFTLRDGERLRVEVLEKRGSRGLVGRSK